MQLIVIICKGTIKLHKSKLTDDNININISMKHVIFIQFTFYLILKHGYCTLCYSKYNITMQRFGELTESVDIGRAKMLLHQRECYIDSQIPT